MSNDPLNYETSFVARSAPRRGVVLFAATIVAVSAVIMNGLLLAVTKDMNGFGGLATAYIIGPFSNCVFAAIALGCIPIVYRLSARAPIWPYILVAGVCPIAAIIVDLAIIHAMNLPGC